MLLSRATPASSSSAMIKSVFLPRRQINISHSSTTSTSYAGCQSPWLPPHSLRSQTFRLQRPLLLQRADAEHHYQHRHDRGLYSTHSVQRETRTVAHANSDRGPPLPLERRSDRELPTLESLSSTRKWATTLPIFILAITISALGIFNYQKLNSPLVAAVLYSLRTNAFVRDLLGDEVYFASKWAWIWGSINLVQGRIDVQFSVKGTKQHAVCRFRAKRLGGKGGSWLTHEWSLTLPPASPLPPSLATDPQSSHVNEKDELVINLLQTDNASSSDTSAGAADPLAGGRF